MKIAAVMLVILLAGASICWGAKRPRRRKIPRTKAKTEQVSHEKKKGKKSGKQEGTPERDVNFYIQKKDSILAAGDSAAFVSAVLNYLSAAGDSVDTAMVGDILWSLEYLAQKGKLDDAKRYCEKLAAVDSSYAPYEDILLVRGYASTGKTGYAYMLARKFQHIHAGTRWGVQIEKLADSLYKQLSPIKPKEKSPAQNAAGSK